MKPRTHVQAMMRWEPNKGRYRIICRGPTSEEGQYCPIELGTALFKEFGSEGPPNIPVGSWYIGGDYYAIRNNTPPVPWPLPRRAASSRRTTVGKTPRIGEHLEAITVPEAQGATITPASVTHALGIAKPNQGIRRAVAEREANLRASA